MRGASLYLHAIAPSSLGAFSRPSTRVRPAARRVEPREGCDLDFAGLGLGFRTGFGRTAVALGGVDEGFGGTGGIGFDCGQTGTLLERVLYPAAECHARTLAKRHACNITFTSSCY